MTQSTIDCTFEDAYCTSWQPFWVCPVAHLAARPTGWRRNILSCFFSCLLLAFCLNRAGWFSKIFISIYRSCCCSLYCHAPRASLNDFQFVLRALVCRGINREFTSKELRWANKICLEFGVENGLMCCEKEKLFELFYLSRFHALFI